MILKLIPSDDPLLHKPIKKCSYNLDRRELASELAENMFHHNGVGLSANQIGISERAFVMMTDLETQATLVLFNPKILKESVVEHVMEEGCLSYPGQTVKVQRPYAVTVKYEDVDKKIHKTKMSGITARIFQHEYDHMEGIDFTQRASWNSKLINL